MNYLAILKSPITWVVAAAIGTLIVLAIVYHKGEKAGSSEVKVDVQREVIKTQDAARISKEKTDEEVHRTPYNDRVNGLR